jgi:hypothetical protein
MSTWRRSKNWLLGHVGHRLVLPLGEPEFFTEDEDSIAKRVQVKPLADAGALLAQAKEMNEGVAKTVESIEARAMTLQGAVAIATTLGLAAGGLLLDPTKIPSHGWRIAFAVALTLTVTAFILSGLRALGASSKTYPWAFPAHEDIFDQAKMDLASAQAARTASYLKSVGLNERIASVKGGYLNAAVYWFRVALALLLASVLMLLVYSVRSDSHSARQTTTSQSEPPFRHGASNPRRCRQAH